MTITFTKESENFFILNVKGTLTFDDLKEFQDKARVAIDRNEKVKVLILAKELMGWGREGDWGNLAFFNEYDSCIEKIAVVTKEKFKDLLSVFLGAGIRQATVEFFREDAVVEARAWLQSKTEN